jgi:hypothetical protein
MRAFFAVLEVISRTLLGLWNRHWDFGCHIAATMAHLTSRPLASAYNRTV